MVTEAVIPNSSQQSITSPKVKTTPEKVRETLEWLGMDFFKFDKYTASRNNKDRGKSLLAMCKRYR